MMIFTDVSWTDIVLKVIESLAGVAGTLLCLIVTLWANKRIKNEAIKQHTIELAKIISDSVNFASQTFVDKMKKDGTWNDETKKEALSIAMNKAMTMMSDSLKLWVVDSYGDLSSYLTTLIEAQIKENSK